MVKRWLVFCGTLAMLLSMAHAQQVMDGSDQVLPGQYVAVLKSLIGEGHPDPYGTELDRLHLKQALVGKSSLLCGRVNYRNQYGGFDGFRLFALSTSDATLAFDAAALIRGC